MIPRPRHRLYRRPVIRPRIHAPAPPSTLAAGFASIRSQMEIPATFPDEVLRNVAALVADGPSSEPRRDMRDVRFVTVDPPGSRDLDQALAIAADADGWRVHYAIADVGAWVPHGSPVEAEAWRRGVTVYLPDGRAPLYPPSLSEQSASLLPDGDRPAVVFTFTVPHDGTVVDASVAAATVRSRAQLTYAEVDEQTVPHLRAAAQALTAAAERRGATQIDMPDQDVEPDPAAPSGYRLVTRARLPSEEWNAQISLAANMVAARMMQDAHAGLFRVMEAPDPTRAADLQAAAVALGYAVADPTPPTAAGPPSRPNAGGAGYRAFRDDLDPWHAAVAAPYGHATAPLRRLADRYVLDLLLGRPLPPDVFARLASVMDAAESRADRASSAAIDLVEAFLLAPMMGETFDAVVTGRSDTGARIQLRDPPVRANAEAHHVPAAGTWVTARLVEADPAARRVRFTLMGAPR